MVKQGHYSSRIFPQSVERRGATAAAVPRVKALPFPEELVREIAESASDFEHISSFYLFSDPD